MVLQRQDMWFRKYLNYTKLIASRNFFGVPQGSIFVPLIFDYLKDLQTFLKRWQFPINTVSLNSLTAQK